MGKRDCFDIDTISAICRMVERERDSEMEKALDARKFAIHESEEMQDDESADFWWKREEFHETRSDMLYELLEMLVDFKDAEKIRARILA